MPIPLNQFENYIDETILERGFSYFQKGHVHEPEEIKTGEYQAIVEGTENYTVRLTIEQGNITKHFCNCPYDMGPVCKHIVALIFYLQQDVLDLTPAIKPAKPKKAVAAKKPPKKKKTIPEQMSDLLEKVSHDELKNFVYEQSINDQPFRNMLLMAFPSYNPNESKDFYAKQLKAFVRASKDGYGYIYYSKARVLGHSMNAFLDAARKNHEMHNDISAFYICTAIMEQMIPVLQYADDSDGDISVAIDTAAQLLYTIAEQQPAEDTRKKLLAYSFETFNSNKFQEWDWHLDLLRLALSLVRTKEEIDLLFIALDTLQNSSYAKEDVQYMTYKLILKSKGEKDATTYLEEHITNPQLRRAALRNAIEKREYHKAVSIAQKGIIFDTPEKPGLVKEWYDWLLQIAEAESDHEKIIEYGRFLFIECFVPKRDYFEILKQHIEPEKWEAFLEDIIKKVSVKNNQYSSEFIANIYIRQEWWERLLEFIKKNPTLHTINRYDKYLSIHYSDEIVDLYGNAIVNSMKVNTGRVNYEEVCHFLRRMIKLGGSKRADEVIASLKKTYPSRKALLDELKRL